jgi:signal peptidase II
MYFGKAELNYEGYAKPLMGNVVDMFHFTACWPWSDPHEHSEIFPPIFNIADASITVGIILIMLFQRRFFPKKEEREEQESADITDNADTSAATSQATEL